MHFKDYPIEVMNVEFVLSRVRATDHCWDWMGTIEIKGYGVFSRNFQGKMHRFRAHKAVYVIFKGQPKPNMVLDHICKNRKCVNPEHLREVSVADNTLENSEGLAAKNKAKTHCKYGHEYSPENTKLDYKKRRVCIACARRNTEKFNNLRKLKKEGVRDE